MTVDDYVAEDGRGPHQAAYVRDLLPPVSARVGLLLVFESPHVDELAAGLPVVGRAGRSGLEYLLGARTGESLGGYVAARHDAQDDRIAVMNVSNVPLQRSAFVVGPEPALTAVDWEVLRHVRTSRANTVRGTQSADANRVGDALLVGLQTRFDALSFGAGSRVVAAGACAQRFVRGLTGLPSAAIEVFHPSYGHWLRHPGRPQHVALRELFARNTS